MSSITRTVCRLATILTFASQASAQDKAEPAPIVTVCEALRNLKIYNGRDIVIVGRYVWTFDGAFLTEDCEADRHISIDGSPWPSTICVSADSEARWAVSKDDEIFPRKLGEVKRTTRLRSPGQGPFADHWAAVKGRLSSPQRLQPPRPPTETRPKIIPGNGFGVNGSVPAQLTRAVILDLP
jgi:hypothetical protein